MLSRFSDEQGADAPPYRFFIAIFAIGTAALMPDVRLHLSWKAGAGLPTAETTGRPTNLPNDRRLGQTAWTSPDRDEKQPGTDRAMNQRPLPSPRLTLTGREERLVAPCARRDKPARPTAAAGGAPC